MTDDPRIEVGRRLQTLRDALGLSLMEIAAQAQMDKAYYRRLELGQIGARGPSDEMQQRIADAYGVDREHIFGPLMARSA